MDTCGSTSRTNMTKPTHHKSMTTALRQQYSLHLRLMRKLPTLFLAVALAGCALDLNLRSGSQPNIAALKNRLSLGQSTIDDVLAILGPPQGKGRAMLPVDSEARTIWSYSYSEASVQTGGEASGDMRSLNLFVFLDQDRYAGYLWFSTLLKDGLRPSRSSP